jgi:hypothetical protein
VRSLPERPAAGNPAPPTGARGSGHRCSRQRSSRRTACLACWWEARLSRAGEAALAAERGTLAPVPIGLISGNTHREGFRPPSAPDRVIEALRQVIRHPRVSDRELTEIIGPPDFLTGCAVTGDLAAMAAGQATDLVLDASITARADGRQIIIENTPPYFSTDDVLSGMARRAREYQWARNHPELRRQARLPLADVRDESSRGSYRFVCVPEPGSGDEVIERLSRVYGVQARVRVHLPKPLPRMIRKDSGPSAMRIFSAAWRSWRRPLSRLGESAGQEAPAAGPARQEQRGPLDWHAADVAFMWPCRIRRASSTTRTVGFGGSPRGSLPSPPGVRARSRRGSSRCSPLPHRRGC